MKTSQREAFRKRFGKCVYDAIFRGKLPEAAVEWPILQVKFLSALRGSGESTAFGQSCLARLDGKQISKQTSFGTCELDGSVERYELPGKPILAGDLGRDGKIYVIQPK